MNENRIRIRAKNNGQELEIEAPPQLAAEWWEKLWPTVGGIFPPAKSTGQSQLTVTAQANSDLPEVFGEYFSGFRSDISDVDKVLIAGAFAQGKEADRAFSTKTANQLLMDQNVKVANASTSVRRLVQTKRVFVVSEGRFRISSTGHDHLRTLLPSE